MDRYAWLEYEDGLWHFVTTLFENPSDATRRWYDRQRAMDDLKKEGWTVVRPYRKRPSVRAEDWASGYGLTRPPGNWPN